ncbi:MAG: 5'-nucleotidase C-terminal domain-containing protein [Chloroflexi bacterium]|nr:5'-nucleotidase C-terminal domain-containing protein [Chloroflexota bacterium]
MSRVSNRVLTFALILVLLTSWFVIPAAAQGTQATPSGTAKIVILHTNDFHGNLELAGSNPGMARAAKVINDVRAAEGAANVALFDAGDEMQGTLLSNLFKGESTIDVFNTLGYQAATFGNHEFDWGKPTLTARTQQAQYPFVTANIVVNDTGNCATAGWTAPTFAQPWTTLTVGAAGNEVKLGIIGVTTLETPIITIAAATEGLCFKDAADSIAHYYAAMKAAGAEVIVVLSHLGFEDGGYGYGIATYGDKTLAAKLNTAGKPADLIIGGHSHTNLTAATKVGNTTIGQAYYAGRKVGRADVTVDKATGQVTIAWQSLNVPTTGAEDPVIKARIATWASNTWYQSEISRIVGYTAVSIARDYNGDSLMGSFVNDAIYNDLNSDATAINDVDMVFNNAGGLRADITATTNPFTLTHGLLYGVLPFGNATIVGDLTGAQILDLLNQSATLYKGALQVSGVRYIFYNYTDAKPGPQPWAWGAYNVQVKNRINGHWEELNVSRTYRIATNEFLAPAGGDGFNGFKYIKNTSYWGDMLDSVERWVMRAYTADTPYSGTLDRRIARNGTATAGPIVPINILHHNDSHGNLYLGRYVGFTQLATLIKQERAHNPTRTLLLNGGDQIQGDAMMYYYKTAPTGFGADGTALPAALQTHPMMAVMNALKYDAWTLGNHEFNFGSQVFQSVMKQSQAPVLQANLTDDGRYGIAAVPVKPSVSVTLPAPSFNKQIKVAILGIGNHRVPNYELPSNIPGLTFTDPIATAQRLAPQLAAANDAVIALTHIGFTSNPKSVEVDTKVDTNLAAQTTGIDVIVGSHSHTDPSKQTDSSGDYLYLPAFVGAPDGTPVLISQAYRYNNYLGEMVLGMLPTAGGGWQVVSRAGRYVPVTTTIPEDPAIKAIVDPYIAALTTYTQTVIGQTTAPIDALKAFTQETNGANLQADASVFELKQHGIVPDFHLSGAMTNQKVASNATPANPTTLAVQDMFTLMPYENSLLMLSMNGPQLKAVLERGYRNYYYYKYVSGYGGYSYYTTCMLDTNKNNQITYRDAYPVLPDGNNVISLNINGVPVDFADAAKYYNVSTVNYLAAGSCNFNNGGVSLWPLSQTVNDTQYYVRDAVIDYMKAQTAPISPAIEGRLQFNTTNVAAATAAAEVAAVTNTPAEETEATWPLSITVSPDVPDPDVENVDRTWTNPWSE